MTRAKRLLSDAAVVLAFFVLIGLGTWQVERLHWKEALIAERSAAFAAPPITGWNGVEEFRRMRLEGTFLANRSVAIGLQGRIVTPLRLDDGTTVLFESHERPQGRGVGEGYLRESEKSGGFTPSNEPAKGQWFTADIPAIAAALALERVRPWRLVAGAPPELPNNHLQYVITWYGLALALAIIYPLARRKFAQP